jgi:hypothetical protein
MRYKIDCYAIAQSGFCLRDPIPLEIDSLTREPYRGIFGNDVRYSGSKRNFLRFAMLWQYHHFKVFSRL